MLKTSDFWIGVFISICVFTAIFYFAGWSWPIGIAVGFVVGIIAQIYSAKKEK